MQHGIPSGVSSHRIDPVMGPLYIYPISQVYPPKIEEKYRSALARAEGLLSAKTEAELDDLELLGLILERYNDFNSLYSGLFGVKSQSVTICLKFFKAEGVPPSRQPYFYWI